MTKIKKSKKVKSEIILEQVGSIPGHLSSYDKVSSAIYGLIGFVAVFLTEIISKIMPFLHLDVIVIDNNFMSLTLGNIVTVVLFFLGVITKKLAQDKSNIFVEVKK